MLLSFFFSPVLSREWKSCGPWRLIYCICCMLCENIYMRQAEVSAIWPDAWSCESGDIVHWGTFIPDLALCPAQLGDAHVHFLRHWASIIIREAAGCIPPACVLAPAELRERGNRKRVVGVWLSRFHLSVRTRRGTPSACADDISWPCCFGQSLLKLFWDKSSSPQTSVFSTYLRVPNRTGTGRIRLRHMISPSFGKKESRGRGRSIRQQGGPRMSKSYSPSCPQIICFPVFATFNTINNTQQVRSCYVCGSRTREHILSFSFSVKMQFSVESHETQPPPPFSVSAQLPLCAAPTEVTIYKSTVTGNMGQRSSSTCRSNHPELRW